MDHDATIIIVGAGAIGASTAHALSAAGHEVLVVEKAGAPAQHQSGRNSGVIHAGYNVKPGSLKAKFCVEGNRRLRDFCRTRDVPMRETGILVVARTEPDRSTLRELQRRSNANGVANRLVARDEIADVEPHAAGLEALHAPEGASFDSTAYVQHLVDEAKANGARFLFDTQVQGIDETASGGPVQVRTSQGTFRGQVAVNCAGLQADRVAAQHAPDLRIIPFRGYYSELVPARTDLVRSHIYGTPDLNFPFLGVHLSRRTDGRVIVGPGAMVAFGREAYTFFEFNGQDLADTLLWPGFWRLFKKRVFRGLVRSEVQKSLDLGAVAAEAQLLVPELRRSDLKGSYAGNRAQVVDRQGKLVDDLVVVETPSSIHVLNAVSPGLTCSLPFGDHLAALAGKRLPR